MSTALASPWKPCDVRGVFPAPVSEELFSRVGAAIGSEMKEGGRAVVGGDFRLSTPALKAALIEALVSTGIEVIDAGQVPTPLVYFEASRSQADAVFIVTASHNPAEHNGLKWMVGDMPPTPSDIARVRAAAESGPFRRGSGTKVRVNPVPVYRAWIETRFQRLRRLKFGLVILDAGNGTWSSLAPEVFRELGFQVECLHCEPDGRFPNRSPDCARPGSLAALQAAVVERKAALGIAWDGDGDRVAFVDENGEHATTDEISVLLARRVLHGTVRLESAVCDIKLSDAVRREVEAAGGTALLERSGHAFMRHRILSSGALLGLDACGHYFFREAGSRDDGLYSALFLLDILNGEHSLAGLRRSAGPMFSTPELRLPSSVLTFPMVIRKLREAFPGANETVIDGSRLTLEEGIILARESSTEAVVSLRIEGFSQEGYLNLVTRCLCTLREGDSLLRHQIEEAGR